MPTRIWAIEEGASGDLARRPASGPSHVVGHRRSTCSRRSRGWPHPATRSGGRRRTAARPDSREGSWGYCNSPPPPAATSRTGWLQDPSWAPNARRRRHCGRGRLPVDLLGRVSRASDISGQRVDECPGSSRRAAQRRYGETGICPNTSLTWCYQCEREHPIEKMHVISEEYDCRVCAGKHQLTFQCRIKSRRW